ncbi:MAG: hypothetical protein AAF355_12870 [Myxococcota bacterium]
MSPTRFPRLAYGTPRKLPRAHDLFGRVVVLDVAFAARAGGASFEKTTLPFIQALGDRLAMWVDHHDHEMHAQYADDSRFFLRTKAQHGACPEMITPERVTAAGPVDTVCCHVDFDGLCSAAKWIRGGIEPYPGADDDARAIDTRLGTPSDRAALVDRALRARFRDDELKDMIVRYLVQGAEELEPFPEILVAAREFDSMEAEAKRLSNRYRIQGEVAICDARRRRSFYDKTYLLLLGQEKAPISLVHDDSTVTVAARFDSGIDLVALLGLDGGMPTRVSVAARKLDEVLSQLASRTPTTET